MGFPRLVSLVLLFAVVWSTVRWLNRLGRELPRQRTMPRRALKAENLTACHVCGSYVADTASGCGRPDCPGSR